MPQSSNDFYRWRASSTFLMVGLLAVFFGFQLLRGTPVAATPDTRTEDWWMPRHEQLVQKAQHSTARVVFYGDSITEGMNVDLLHSIIGADATNYGIGGDRTEHLLWRLQHGETPVNAPEVAVLLIGTNNLDATKVLSRRALADIGEGVRASVRELQARLPNTKILIVGVLPREAHGIHPIRQQIETLNRFLRDLSDNRQVFFVDPGTSLLESDKGLATEVMPDLLHPSDEGYRRLFTALKPAIDRLRAARP